MIFNPADKNYDNQYLEIPAGTYLCRATKSDYKETKKKNGFLFSLTFEIVEGDYIGSNFTDYFNIVNPNADSEHIGRRNLAAFCRAINFNKSFNPEDGIIVDLYNKRVLVKLELNEYGGKKYPQVKGYLKYVSPAEGKKMLNDEIPF